MRLLKCLFLPLAIFGSSYCGAQTFDSLTVDSSTKWPGYAHVRIKFPHDGFRFTGYSYTSPLMLPPLTNVVFFFDECPDMTDTGESISQNATALLRSTAVTYYDTTVDVYIQDQARFIFAMYLNPNTTNPNCVMRSSYVLTDSVHWGYIWEPGPGAVENVEKTTQVVVYPNPITDYKFTINANKSNSVIATALLYDLQGILLATYAVGNIQAELTIPNHLATRNYVVMVKLMDGTVERKLITVK